MEKIIKEIIEMKGLYKSLKGSFEIGVRKGLDIAIKMIKKNMENKNREKAELFLNNAGYGVGSNYSTGIVIDLMKGFFEEQTPVKSLDIHNLMTILKKVTRVEVIDKNGRSYVNWDPVNKTKISLQDNDKTLKVIIT